MGLSTALHNMTIELVEDLETCGHAAHHAITVRPADGGGVHAVQTCGVCGSVRRSTWTEWERPAFLNDYLKKKARRTESKE